MCPWFTLHRVFDIPEAVSPMCKNGNQSPEKTPIRKKHRKKLRKKQGKTSLFICISFRYTVEDTICQYMPVSPEFLRGFTATHLALQGSEMVHQRHTQMAPWRRKPVAVCQNWGSRPLADKNSSARTFIRASANRNSCALFQSVPLQ